MINRPTCLPIRNRCGAGCIYAHEDANAYIQVFSDRGVDMSEATGGSNRFKTLSNDELALFFTETAMFYQAGISVSEGVHIVMDAATGQGREVLSALSRCIDEENMAFSKAMSAVGCFPDYAVNMIDIGEQTGKMDEVMASLGRYYERESAVDKNIRSALTYPLIMVSMMVLVVVVLITQVLPIFNRVFTQLGSQMGEFPRMAMELGQFITQYSFVFIGLLVVFVAFIWILRFARSDNKVVTGLRYFIFGGKKVAAKVDAGRFAAAMNLMLASGLDPEESLETLERLMDDAGIRQKVQQCRTAIGSGVSLADALVQAELFDQGLAMLLPLGFKTGNLDQVMRHIADRCENEVDERIDNAIGIIEPTLVGVLSVVVGAILLSTMIPLMGIMTSIGG